MNLRRSLFASLVIAAAPLWARPALRPQFSADDHDYNLATGHTVMKGHATVVYGDMELHADEIDYDVPTSTAVAKGHVILNIGTKRVLADQITYHLKDGTYTLLNPRLGQFPLFIRGAQAEGNRNTVTLDDAVVSYGEPGKWTPSLSADRILYNLTGPADARASGVRLGLGVFKPFPLPSIQQSAAVSLRSQMSLMAGYRGQVGAFADAGIRVPILPGLRVGGNLGLFTKRGVMFGPAADYSSDVGGDHEIVGSLRTGYISDHGPAETDILGNPVPVDRSYLTWEHHQVVYPGLTLDGSFNYWSDSEVMRDYSPRQFFPVQEPDSYLESVFSSDNVQISLFGRFQPNHFYEVQQRSPEIRVDLLPIPLAYGVYERMQLSFARLTDDAVLPGQTTLRTDRADLYYGLTRTFAPKPWLGFTAVAGGRITHYRDTLPAGGGDPYTRTLGEVGFDAHLLASGTFNYTNKRWGIDGLRHLIIPKISYRYIPEAQKGQAYIPPIDRLSFDTYLPELGLGDTRAIDQLQAMNTLRLSVENVLQTRDAKYGSRDLASLTLANDFRFERQTGERKVSATHIDLALMPARWMRFELYQRLAPQDFSIRELNTGLTIHDGDEWSARIATHYLVGQISEYVLDVSRRLNESYSTFARLRYDARLNRMDEQTYGIDQTIANAWSIRYGLSIYSGPRREGRFGLSVEVEALRF